MKGAVVKLGGSTMQADTLRVWLDALAGSRLPLVVVPGGGPFADEVRAAQARLGFSDTAAHAMALLAMEQFGRVILDFTPRFAAAASLAEMETLLEAGRTPVWLPSSLALSEPAIEPSWNVTSDALAAWLAGRIGAAALLLVKQTGAFSPSDDAVSLSERGIVDAALPSMLPSGVEFRLSGPEDAAVAAALLAAGRLPGIAIGSAVTREAG